MWSEKWPQSIYTTCIIHYDSFKEIACFETDLKTNYRKPDQQRIPKIRESREKSIQCIDHVQLHQTETGTTYW